MPGSNEARNHFAVEKPPGWFAVHKKNGVGCVAWTFVNVVDP
jgi:hypothetical protein